MVAMRLASEQPLINACSSSVDASRSAGAEKSPSLEALMTLLWATHSISKENIRREQQQLDVTTEIRQACDELDGLFRQRKMHVRQRAFTDSDGDVLRQKSSESFRLARF